MGVTAQLDRFAQTAAARAAGRVGARGTPARGTPLQ